MKRYNPTDSLLDSFLVAIIILEIIAIVGLVAHGLYSSSLQM